MSSNYSDILLSAQLKFHNLSTSRGGQSIRQVKKYILATVLLQEVFGSVRNSAYTDPMANGCKTAELAASLKPFFASYFILRLEAGKLGFEIWVVDKAVRKLRITALGENKAVIHKALKR